MKVLLFFFSLLVFANKCFSQEIYPDKTFNALLHFYKNTSDIQDPNFFTQKNFSNSQIELENEKDLFFRKLDQKSICQFPARYFYLSNKFNNSKSLLDNCEDLNDFINRVPIETISVVFASENISMPTSMMGHIFLKLSGKNKNGEIREHAISFFTDVDRISFIKVVIGSLITGLDGVYALTPYNEVKLNYLYNEQRNIYEYQLKLDSYQKKLLIYHLYELKNINIKYLFHALNCATVISNILSINYPEIKNERSNWVTPLDVVRSLYKNNDYETTLVTLSSTWKIKSLQDSIQFPVHITNNIKNQNYENLVEENHSTQKNFLNIILARSYNDYLFENNKISRDEWNKVDDLLIDKKKNVLPAGQLDLSQYKSPAKTIQDSQWKISYSDQKKLSANFLFASHSLADDTSNYTNESELKLGEIKIDWDLSKKSLNLGHINFYSTKILKPHDSLLGGSSFKFDFSFLNEDIYQHSWRILYGQGKTFRLHHDLDVFGLLNIEGKTNDNRGFFVGPELGFILRQIYNLKLIASVNREFKLLEKNNYIQEFNFTEQLNLKNSAIGLNYIHQIDFLEKNKSFRIYYKYFF